VAYTAFSPNGALLVSAAGREVILWDVASGRPIGPAIECPTLSMSLHPQGETLACGGSDEILLWDLRLEAWQEQACQMAGRNLNEEEWRLYLRSEPYRKTCPQWP
jgi:WD40 repeat protein